MDAEKVIFAGFAGVFGLFMITLGVLYAFGASEAYAERFLVPLATIILALLFAFLVLAAWKR